LSAFLRPFQTRQAVIGEDHHFDRTLLGLLELDEHLVEGDKDLLESLGTLGMRRSVGRGDVDWQNPGSRAGAA
jgi:hypothetical protein